MNNCHLLSIQHFHQSQRLRKDDRDLDTEEENWFNDDTDEIKFNTTLVNDDLDDKDNQSKINVNSRAISINEPIRPRHVLINNEDDELPIACREKTSSTKISFSKMIET